MTNAEKLEELLRSDEELQDKIRAAVKEYKGDLSDDRVVFDAVVVPLAEEKGLPVTYDEYLGHVSGLTKLPDDEADSVAGGGSYCFLIGGSSKPEDYACLEDEGCGEHGAVACGYVGVGFFDNFSCHGVS